jgi:signal transduction histidine kinase
MKPTILYVDDELPNLDTFRANFRHNYEILLADSAEQAIALMQDATPEVLLADQRLPNMSGVELLTWVQQHRPEIVRILITGYNDLEPVVEAINKGSIYYFVQKPWNLDQLKGLLFRGVQHYNQQKLIKQQNSDLRKMVDELERFVYSISHDIRAPLMSVKGLIQIARLEPESSATYIDMMEVSINKLDTFIRSIIDHNKNKQTETTVEKINIAEMLELIVDTQIPLQLKKEIKVNTSISQAIPFLSDEFRLGLIIGNLVNNSAKYSNQNRDDKRISISVEVNENAGTFVIEDNGRGIAEKHLGAIFNIFYRISSDNSGSGLGLYLVKETVSKLGGTICVESELGVFTKFIVKIPNGQLP